MKYFKAILSVAVTLLLIWALQTKFGGLPPIGKFLNPCNGFWQNAESKHILTAEKLTITGLQNPVVIRYDEHMVPHIFADNDHDLYLAQGYVTARDRLWQMDIQTRSAAGRLAEIIGPKALDIDRYHRRIGMVYGAENTLRGLMKDPEMRLVVNAYTAGINAYVHELSPRDYPIEFKLLDYAPEQWKPINCAFLLKLMSETLAGGSNQLAMTNTLDHFGPQVMNELFTDGFYHEDPVIPASTKWNFKPLPIPKPSPSFLAQQSGVKTIQKTEGIGSNNWVVAGSKTTSGYPILANDPHLNLTFPSIWYQAQLVAPGVNVNGVSLPGAPGIVIGYNDHISWGVTNVDADVLDWYQIKFKDATRRQYWYNNKWNPTTRRIEVINIRGQQPFTDTVIYTHHGPVVYETTAKKPAKSFKQIPVGDAVRWIAHDESDDLKTFYLLNRGKNYADYRRALTFYTAPAQNFIFAGNDKDIALTPNGRFPLKFKDQGKYVLDGSDPANDWQGWIPAEQNPTAKNPEQGYLSSANQTSVGPSYPYYINWLQGNYQRARRINSRLGVMKNATVDSMRILQTDNYSILAEDMLSIMTKYIDATKLDNNQRRALNMVTRWNKRFDADEPGASIFMNWYNNFYNLTWSDDFGAKGTFYNWPTGDRTQQLLIENPDSKWFDIKGTPVKETGSNLVNLAFVKTVNDLYKKYGKPGEKWQWGNVKETNINHLANIPGFGTGQFKTGGNNSVVNALIDGHGPSWRMVVEMGPAVTGYGVFPGGESGNPGSFFYEDMFNTWRNGKLNKLLFLKTKTEPSRRIVSTLTLSN